MTIRVIQWVQDAPSNITWIGDEPAPGAFAVAAVIGPQGVPGQGVIAGGTTGQVLAKNSNSDYDTVWETLSPGGVTSFNTRTGAVTLTSGDVTTALTFTPENVAHKGVANGYASLDSGGTVPLSQIPSSLIGAVEYQGSWNAATNSPVLTSGTGTKGWYYVVSTAGSTNLNGITVWKIGDWAIYNGTVWQKVDNNNLVSSVNGYTGTVNLSYSDVGAPSVSGVNATGTWGINVSGNAATVTNGLYSTGSYSNPSWLTSVAGSIVSGNISGSAANVTGTVGYANGGTGLTAIPANGQIDIGNGTGFTRTTLSAGTGIGITNGAGSVSIANSAPMTYPASGIANSTGSAWGTSYTTSGSGTVVALAASPTITGTVTFGGTNLSAAAWTTNGVGIIQAATTYTDTTSSGSVGQIYVNNFAAPTVAASNAVSVGNLIGTHFADPIAGTNVTVATNKFAIAADSALFSSISISGQTIIAPSVGSSLITIGTTYATGQITIGFSSVSQNISLATGATASGYTKTVIMGTGGLSGSTTTIAIGSAVSGATQTTTVNGRVTLAPIGATVAAWSTSGVGLVQSAATFTDSSTSASGTVTTAYMNYFAPQTYAASNTITVTNLYGTYFDNPVRNAGVSGTTTYALAAASIFSPGNITSSGTISASTTLVAGNGLTVNNGALTLTGSSGAVTHNIASGATTSGNTKTVNIGTGGVSGSTTNITIGAAVGTSTTTLNGSTVATGTIQLQGYTVATLPTAGTAGRRAYVTDAVLPTFLGTLTGGGTVKTPVFDNGTNWVAG